MAVRLIDSLTTTAAIAEIFSDQSVLQAMLDFEVALAQAEARLNVIPQSAADAIARAAKDKDFDVAALAAAARHTATPAIPFIQTLTEKVRAGDAPAAACVHWGATSQDLCDTALVLLLEKASPHLQADLARIENALRELAEQHKDTVMLGRTLMQAAGPTTFGLKAAGWLGAVSRSHERLQHSFEEALVLQFGGASGTLAALGGQGLSVAQSLAAELGLKLPDAPWHTHRDRLATLVCDCGILVGSLGKIARDITLMMQNEVGEASEPSGPNRGGSSAMPHKVNPVGCTVALAAANRAPGLVSSFLSGIVQEHERAAGGWQAECSTISAVIGATAVALASMAEVAEGLTVNAARMRANIEATRGAVFAERAMMLLAAKIGRQNARKIVEDALCQSVAQQLHLADVLSANQQVKEHLGAAELTALEKPELYLGSAEEFRKHLLHSAQKKNVGEEE